MKAHFVKGWVRILARDYLNWNRRLLLDPWLRYRAVIAILRTREKMDSVLDVGSGSVGLAYFLQSPAVAADLDFSWSDLAYFRSPISPVRASATHLPFRDASFDVTVCVDMLEHVPPADRTHVIIELFRVSRDLLVIGFPFGRQSERFDQEMLALERQLGDVPPWREEHVQNGLPGSETHKFLIETARRTPRPMAVSWFGQEGLVGLQLRSKLLHLVRRESRLYGAIFAPLYALHAYGSRRNAYRRIYVMQAPGPPGRPLEGTAPDPADESPTVIGRRR